MTEINYDEMTKQIIEGINNSNNINSVNKNMLRTEIGSTILGRFVLYKPDPKNSIYHYFHHGWKTNAGTYQSYLCPQTYGERCPICSKSISLWKSNNDFLKEQSKKIRRKENWMVNFYVIDDNKNPDNNGKVKIFRYGQQVKDIIEEALLGTDKELYGKNIWRFNNGCSFRIQVKANSDKKDAWPSYTSSKFLPASELDLSAAKISEILDSTYNTSELFTKMSEDELAAELQKNFIDDLNREQSTMDSGNRIISKPEVRNTEVRPKPSVSSVRETQPETIRDVPNTDSEIDDLLKELD